MKNDLTLIAVVLDRSGSMSTIQSDMEGGLNTFIKEQAAQPGECRLTLTQFDDTYEVLADYIDIHEAPHYALVPRGSTALLDAIGKTVTTVGEKLASLPETDRPSKVLVAVITDGHENASKDWQHAKVLELINKQRDDYKWEFTYLGAGENAIDAGTAMGFAASNSIQWMNDAAYRGSPIATFDSLSARTSSYRVGANFAYTDDDREATTTKDDDAEKSDFQTLEGITTGRYVVTTYSGTRHYVDLDACTAIRKAVAGHEWGDTIIKGELGGGGSRPKALVTIEPITPDGTPFHFTLIRDAEVGKQMRLDNEDEWRITSQVQSIETWADD